MKPLKRIAEGYSGAEASNIIYENDTELENRIDAVSGGVGNAVLGVAPDPKILTYNVSASGTYPLYGGLEVAPEDFIGNWVQFRNIGGVWQKFITPNSSGAIDLSRFTLNINSAKNL